jgi:flavin reductase (DIM6/NTAB) family NADH-FMN oxidoreductase RutF
MERVLGQLDGALMIINPADHTPVNLYRLLVGAIVPRPIAFVSTISSAGVLNLAPFSFFTAVSANPPVICFSPMVRPAAPGALKDTLRNIEDTREFVVNIVSEDFAQQMNLTSADFPPEVDEFAASGLTPLPSDLVRPPRVRESRIHMECGLLFTVHVSALPLGGSLVLGKVLRLHIDDSLIADFKIDPAKLRAIGRMAGATYARTTDRFEMPRPRLK